MVQLPVLYELCLQSELPQDIYNDTLYRLAFIHKRNNNYLAAIPLWEQATARNQIYAYEELAKYYEHHTQNLGAALSWTMLALDYIGSSSFLELDNIQWKIEFQHRLERLQRKISPNK